MTSAIEFKRVSRLYGDLRAVDDVSFRIQPGEFFAMLGPSGSGKTTCLRLVAGFDVPTSGQVMLDGVDVSGVPPYERNVNTVFQDYALFPHMTVLENVAYGPRVRGVSAGERAQRAQEMLELVQLGSQGAGPHSFPGVSGSASRWRARSSITRRSCCSTSRWARWISSCAKKCRSSSRACRRSWASPSST
jgi:ABC-type Fe3+/spermidine/putrescine transport system ATPase subunit